MTQGCHPSRRGEKGRPTGACLTAFLIAALAWPAAAGIAGQALGTTNAPVVVRKAVPVRPPNAGPRAFYFGSRLESVTSSVAPQNPYDANYAGIRHPLYKAVVGFRLALTSRAFMFVGVGLTLSGDLLDQETGHALSISAAQIQNALGMQTEYGLGWNF